LFLPLKEIHEKDNLKFHFITPDNRKLALINKSYELRTIKFKIENDDSVIYAQKVENEFVFTPCYSKMKINEGYNEEDFLWVFDLKDLHSQRIINDYAREISRVGLDESEWLRRWAI